MSLCVLGLLESLPGRRQGDAGGQIFGGNNYPWYLLIAKHNETMRMKRGKKQVYATSTNKLDEK